ncbi:oxidoreductase [Paenibacillus nasutitermitis]|uniref:Oxidoreductase n=1 Tax=Paenibacillus nasutitermitis TaxID=1652958 RepID=A0A916YY65_9BACL|nr:oxidoreductase [Paenibacillus nasutitermitis]
MLLLDARGGRSTLCRRYHNLLGWPEGISGESLLRSGRTQAEALGVQLLQAEAVKAEISGSGFDIHTLAGETYSAERLLLATGVQDRVPADLQLRECLGTSIYICPDCDGYEIKGRRALVLGAGNAGAEMALVLRYWTTDIIYINHEKQKLDNEKISLLNQQGILYMEEQIVGVDHRQGALRGVRLSSGAYIEAACGFIAFGGNKVQSELARQLGVKLLDNHHISVDARTKMTDIRHLWAAGDVTAHSEQAAIAMGDGAQAAIWIHKSLVHPSSRLLIQSALSGRKAKGD